MWHECGTARNGGRLGAHAWHHRDVTDRRAPGVLFCAYCLRDGKARFAWTVSGGEALCVRHAVASFGIEDDMREHLLFEDVYEELRLLGFDDTY